MTEDTESVVGAAHPTVDESVVGEAHPTLERSKNMKAAKLFTLVLAGLAWNQGTVLAQVPTGNLIQDADLEPGTVLHPFARVAEDPWIPGEWNAEDADVIGSVAGISPRTGDGMLRVNVTGLSASQVNQIIDVSTFGVDIDAGNAVAQFSIWTNAPAANVSPSLLLRAGVSQTSVGTLVPDGGFWLNGFNMSTLTLSLDSDKATWEQIDGAIALPCGTRFLEFQMWESNASIPPDGVFFDTASVVLVPPDCCGGIDIKPGSCPNPFNLKGHGVLPVALTGTTTFDVTDVDVSSVRLVRADGVGGAVAPNEGPPGPHSEFDDVATPFDGDPCNCHSATGDGIMDLMMHFRSDDVDVELELDGLPSGSVVQLQLTGNLLGGCPFTTPVDCIWIVPPNVPPGVVRVTSNLPDTWMDVDPFDFTLEAGGFATFVRGYFQGQSVTLTVQENQVPSGYAFRRWVVDGVLQPWGQRTIQVTVQVDMSVRALYRQVVVPGGSGRPGPIQADPTVGAGL